MSETPQLEATLAELNARKLTLRIPSYSIDVPDGYAEELRGLLQEVLDAITSGDIKYTPGDWREIVLEDSLRFQEKLERHIDTYFDAPSGEIPSDSDSGLHPLAHVAANCLILIYGDRRT
jgi:hypothetical protein